jgi:hypothetical protein
MQNGRPKLESDKQGKQRVQFPTPIDIIDIIGGFYVVCCHRRLFCGLLPSALLPSLSHSLLFSFSRFLVSRCDTVWLTYRLSPFQPGQWLGSPDQPYRVICCDVFVPRRNSFCCANRFNLSILSPYHRVFQLAQVIQAEVAHRIDTHARNFAFWSQTASRNANVGG